MTTMIIEYFNYGTALTAFFDRKWKKCFEAIPWCDRREGIAFQLSNLPFHSVSLRDCGLFSRVYKCLHGITLFSTCVSSSSSSSSSFTYRDIYNMVDRCGLIIPPFLPYTFLLLLHYISRIVIVVCASFRVTCNDRCVDKSGELRSDHEHSLIGLPFHPHAYSYSLSLTKVYIFYQKERGRT